MFETYDTYIKLYINPSEKLDLVNSGVMGEQSIKNLHRSLHIGYHVLYARENNMSCVEFNELIEP